MREVASYKTVGNGGVDERVGEPGAFNGFLESGTKGCGNNTVAEGISS